jgi:group I intron endonuclease
VWIYKITNLLNGKCYIGQTIRSPTERWSYHKFNNNGDTAIHRAIQKYGLDNFSFDVIDFAENPDMLDHKENFWADCYNSYTSSGFGYNVRQCGQGKGGAHSDETKAKLSKAHLGLMHSDETKKKISIARTGVPKSDGTKRNMCMAQRGIIKSPTTEETKRLLSKHMKELWADQEYCEKHLLFILRGGRNGNATPVRCVETGEVFLSIIEAGIAKGIKSPINISTVCRGKQKTCGGFHWEYIKTEGN